MMKKLPIYDVYVNLHTGGLSARFTSGKKYGRVAVRCHTAIIHNPAFRVQPGSHRRTVESKVRCVHAMVRGHCEIDVPINEDLTQLTRLRYNPFEHDYFFVAGSGERIEHAARIILNGHALYLANP